jgi:hypothetical protein
MSEMDPENLAQVCWHFFSLALPLLQLGYHLCQYLQHVCASPGGATRIMLVAIPRLLAAPGRLHANN